MKIENKRERWKKKDYVDTIGMIISDCPVFPSRCLEMKNNNANCEATVVCNCKMQYTDNYDI